MQLTPCASDVAKLSKTGPFVLVVDDMVPCLEIIQAVFEQHGYRTLGADNGAEGLALLRELGPENIRAVVTDLEMPDMTGLQLLESIQRQAPDMKVLCLSGSPSALARVTQVPGRVTALPKTAGMGELLNCLEALLESRASV